MFRPVRLARPEDSKALQQHGLNQRSPTEGKGKRQKLIAREGTEKVEVLQQHALKGQKLLAQGNALGIIAIGNAPCKGKSFMYCLGVLKLLPLQGDNLASITTQGAALGYELLPFQGVLGNFNRTGRIVFCKL